MTNIRPLSMPQNDVSVKWSATVCFTLICVRNRRPSSISMRMDCHDIFARTFTLTPLPVRFEHFIYLASNVNVQTMLDDEQGFDSLHTSTTCMTDEPDLTTMVVPLSTIFNYVQDNLPKDYLMQQASIVVFEFINGLFKWSRNQRSVLPPTTQHSCAGLLAVSPLW